MQERRGGLQCLSMASQIASERIFECGWAQLSSSNPNMRHCPHCNGWSCGPCMPSALMRALPSLDLVCVYKHILNMFRCMFCIPCMYQVCEAADDARWRGEKMNTKQFMQRAWERSKLICPLLCVFPISVYLSLCFSLALAPMRSTRLSTTP